MQHFLGLASVLVTPLNKMAITHSRQNGAQLFSRDCATSPTVKPLPPMVGATVQLSSDGQKTESYESTKRRKRQNKQHRK